MENKHGWWFFFKQEFERFRTKISSEFVQDLASGFRTQDDIELLIEKTDDNKESLTKTEIQEIYNELFIDSKRGHSTRHKVSNDSENTTRAKNIFIHILREGKLKELGI